MAYNESLAGRLRDVLARRRGIVEKRMFGGVVFLLDGNILVGVWKDSLIARLGPERAADALCEPHVGVFDITGRPMRNWVIVSPDGIENDQSLRDWVERSTHFVRTLPPRSSTQTAGTYPPFERRIDAGNGLGIAAYKWLPSSPPGSKEIPLRPCHLSRSIDSASRRAAELDRRTLRTHRGAYRR